MVARLGMRDWVECELAMKNRERVWETMQHDVTQLPLSPKGFGALPDFPPDSLIITTRNSFFALAKKAATPYCVYMFS